MKFFLRSTCICQIFFITCTIIETIMAEQNEIQLFDGKQVRYVWNEEQEKYFFSVVDVIRVLTDSETLASIGAC